MKLRLVYVTASDAEEAGRIARVLVAERLAAGVNVIGGVGSTYWWRGEMRQETEAVLIAQTTDALVPQLVARVKELHSYECPCVVSVPIMDGNQDFLEWIAAETK